MTIKHISENLLTNCNSGDIIVYIELTPMDEETADLFKQLAKKMMKGIE